MSSSKDISIELVVVKITFITIRSNNYISKGIP